MGTTITPQLVDIVDTRSKVRKYSSGTTRRLTTCQEERWGLRVDCPTPDDPFHDHEVTWLLPELNVRLTRQHPRSRHARGEPTTLTAARIRREGSAWRTTDLLLGLSTADCGPMRIIGFEEFAAAVAGGVLRPCDADLALQTVHRMQEELSGYRHDLGSWLAGRHIFEVWPAY